MRRRSIAHGRLQGRCGQRKGRIGVAKPIGPDRAPVTEDRLSSERALSDREPAEVERRRNCTTKSGASRQSGGSVGSPGRRFRVRPRRRESAQARRHRRAFRPATARPVDDTLRSGRDRRCRPPASPRHAVAVEHFAQIGRARQDVVARVVGIAAEPIADAQVRPCVGHDLHQAHCAGRRDRAHIARAFGAQHGAISSASGMPNRCAASAMWAA